MFDKLMQAQQMAEEIKKNLENVVVTGEAEGGKITVTATGNKDIRNISIDPDFLASADREELEELLIVAVNKAIQQADIAGQQQTQKATQDLMGGLGAMFGQ
ncbi:MAG: YbaB/EbfC family nucleoid-associated protein [Sphingobacteriaceae bacterium]|jgi:DNA-binding YbaB/EbfC family protein|nr:YbaB/EbfC family nucleoid-associated protein [Sphingobacteriaceae bacterium]